MEIVLLIDLLLASNAVSIIFLMAPQVCRIRRKT